jgi:hypothetical protein
MIRLLVQKAEAGFVVKVGPVNAAGAQPLAQRLDRSQELTLLDRESANRKLNRSALLE